MKPLRRTTGALAAVATLTLTLAACSDDGEDSTTGSGSEDTSQDESTEDSGTTDEPMDEETTDDGMTDEEMASGPVGPGCADYAEMVPEGEGSVEGMAEAPVATAASNNPMLQILVQAVSGELNPDVNLVDTLNGDEFTVFAPVNDAFAEIDSSTIETLESDADMLTSILTYHVVPGQMAPEDIAGEQTTVQGDTITVEGDPEALTVNDANVICGGVATANATVYMVDSVLMPPMN